MVVVYILLFIVCLSTLIMVHEFGHLLTAKMFNVYCFEYAIGFGPKLFSFKRKNGETYFSLRAIPFGGFVSMYGEAETVPEGLVIDENRSLLKIKKWKRAIIMVAGVTMNFILAILVFFVYEIGFPTHEPRYAHITVSETTLAYEAGLRSGDFLYAEVGEDENGSLVFYDDSALVKLDNNEVIDAYFGFKYYGISYNDASLYNTSIAFESITNGELTISEYVEMSVKDIASSGTSITSNVKTTGYVEGIYIDDDHQKVSYIVNGNFGEEVTKNSSIVLTATYRNGDERTALISIPVRGEITAIGTLSTFKDKEETYVQLDVKDYNYLFKSPDYKGGNLFAKKDGRNLTSISFDVYRVVENDYQGRGKEMVSFNDIALSLDGETYKLPKNIGFNMQIDQHMNDFGTSVRNTFVDFGNASIVIFKSLGQLLTNAAAWKEVGGIIAVGVLTTRTLQQYGFGQFLFMWALISVNLGIVNLLPFPGLDGWQLLVTAIEGITRKEVPSKVKSIVSVIGIGLLFLLMIVIIVKDLVTFVF